MSGYNEDKASRLEAFEKMLTKYRLYGVMEE